jgi:Na+/H+ antiporter NhaB
MRFATLVYGSLFLILSCWLTVRHVYNPNASIRSKRLVMVISSVMAGIYFCSGFAVLAVIVETAIGTYIILHHLITSTPEQTQHTDHPVERQTDQQTGRIESK